MTAEHLCAMHNFEYQSVSDRSDLKNALEVFYQASNKPKILEVFTPSTKNDEVLLNYFNYIK